MIWDKILDYCREKQIWAEKTMEVTDWNMVFGSGIKEQEDYIRKRDNIAGMKLFKIDGELSIVSHPFSYGGKEDKFEIMEVGNAEIEVVIGYLTAEEVIRYIENWFEK